MFYVNCKGTVVDSITPGVKIGGEVTRAVEIKKVSNCPGEKAAAIVAVQKLFSISALLLVLILTAGRFIFLPFLLIFLCIFLMPRKIKILAEKINSHRETTPLPAQGRVRKAANALRAKISGFLSTLAGQVEIVREKKIWLPLFLLAMVIWVIYPGKMYILAVQFVPDIGFFYVAAITFAAYMVAMIPIFPGGLGGFEGTMAGLLAATGVAVTDAAVIAVFFRFVSFWFVMILGAVYIALYKKVLPTIRD
jgi:uncharacterized protein (TIRG00374 family)